MAKANFLNLLIDHEGGGLLMQADNHLAEIVNKVRDEGGKAELTLKIKFAGRKLSAPKVRRVDVTCEVTAKIPTPAPDVTGFYTTPDGELSTKHPSQMDMFEDDPKPVQEEN